jgi:hypothetical protein
MVVLRVQGPSPNVEQTDKIIMSLYKFISKTHCLPSEDLGKNMQKMWMLVVVTILLKRLCSGFRVHVQI